MPSFNGTSGDRVVYLLRQQRGALRRGVQPVAVQLCFSFKDRIEVDQFRAGFGGDSLDDGQDLVGDDLRL